MLLTCRKKQPRGFCSYLWPLLFSLLSATGFAAQSDTLSELHKIDALLEAVKASDVTFIRNGKDYTSTEAYEHLQRKLRAAQGSWFAPPKEKWTARMFIEKIASGSSLTGRSYWVRFDDGKILKSRDWLVGLLNEMETRSAAPPKPE